jgi:hypothetical protein
MSVIPFFLRQFQNVAPVAAETNPFDADEATPVVPRQRSLGLDVFWYVLLTVVGPAAAVLAIAAALSD